MPGVFITFEGIDGSGKTTQLKILSRLLEQQGMDVLCIREPGGTLIGEGIREILLDGRNTAMSDRCELLLYEAARAQIADEVIRPALDASKVVLCDRFLDSTLAYQGFGRGLDPIMIGELSSFATAGLIPDRTLFFRIPMSVSRSRLMATGADPDRLERSGDGFFERVASGFERIAESDPDRIRVVDGEGTPVQTALLMLEEVADLFPALDPGAAGRLVGDLSVTGLEEDTGDVGGGR